MGLGIKKEMYGKYGNVLKLTSGKLDLIVTLDMGPRIISFTYDKGSNVFNEDVEVKVEHAHGIWHIYGGHRLWHSPEAMPRTYMPDNEPVQYVEEKDSVVLRPKAEPYTQIQKEIRIKSVKDGVRITHKLTNNNAWPVELALWALTVCARNGDLIIPLSKRQTGLLPNRLLVLWPYSKPDDPRFSLTQDFVLLKQDPYSAAPFKFGMNNEDGWAAYLVSGFLFVKKYRHIIGATYPDFGASTEAYAAEWGMEVGTLSPVAVVQPGQALEHEETWHLMEAEKLLPGDTGGIAERVSSL
ncbi:MAG: hypothetical protein Q8O09_04075 [Bacillota bacterium]|nr:hypothetical protein [Bacillota bacterium]